MDAHQKLGPAPPVATPRNGSSVRSAWTWVAVPGVLLVALACLLLSQGMNPAAATLWSAHQAMFLSLNHGLAALPATLWLVVTTFGDSLVLGPLLLLLLLRKPQAWAALVMTVPIGAAYSRGLKYWADAPRPAAVLDNGLFHIVGPTLTSHGFPSGHTVAAFAAAGAAVYTVVASSRGVRDSTLALFIVAGAFAIGISRIAVGAHWPIDVLAGAAGGWICGVLGAVLAARYRTWWTWAFSGPGRPATAAALLVWAVALWMQPQTSVALAVLYGLAACCAAGEALALAASSRWSGSFLNRRPERRHIRS